MRRGAICLSSIMFLLTLSAMAQEEPRMQIGLQGNGFFTKSSSGSNVQQSTTESGGFLVDFRYNLNNWLSADVAYGRNGVTNKYVSSGFSTVEATAHQVTGGLVLYLPFFRKIRPYVLAEGGAIVFDPTGSQSGFASKAQIESAGTFAYGGGVDYPLFRYVALRAEYRGLVYDSPDFHIHGLDANAVTHTAEPSAGIVIRF